MSGSSAPFSLGFFSDVQYANRTNRGASHYRDSLRFLAEAVKCFNERDLRAVINLGDLVDSNDEVYIDAVLSVLNDCIHPVIHILGNHDLLGPNQRQEVLSWLNMERAWGQCFSKNNWRVVVVDSTEVSMHSEEQVLIQESVSRILHLNDMGDPCAEDWNGMASNQQLQELEGVLVDALKCDERVLIINHMLVGKGSGSSAHRCWNHRELSYLFSENRCVAAHFNGHDHDGGFTTDISTGVHYLTFPAICDSSGKIGAHAIARFEQNSINVEGWGRIQSRTLDCHR